MPFYVWRLKTGFVKMDHKYVFGVTHSKSDPRELMVFSEIIEL